MYFFDFNPNTRKLQGLYVADKRNETIPDTAITVDAEDYFAASYDPTFVFTLGRNGKIIKGKLPTSQ